MSSAPTTKSCLGLSSCLRQCTAFKPLCTSFAQWAAAAWRLLERGCQKLQKKCICEKKRTESREQERKEFVIFEQCIEQASRRFFSFTQMHLTRKYLNKNRHFIDQLIKKICRPFQPFKCHLDYIKTDTLKKAKCKQKWHENQLTG